MGSTLPAIAADLQDGRKTCVSLPWRQSWIAICLLLACNMQRI